MGTGYSIDTPLRVAHLGIASVVSLVDDLLIERVHAHHAHRLGFAFTPVDPRHPEARSLRIRQYFDFLQEAITRRFEQLRSAPLDRDPDKQRYFRLLPDTSRLRQRFQEFLDLPTGSRRDELESELSSSMRPGSIDANIMVKLDRLNLKGVRAKYSDAKAALKGYAESKVESSIVFSAGINQSLFSFMTEFQDFYRDQRNRIRKRIILKVSDFRSALIQARFLAKKGLEVYEFRIESGLNCGGHAFASPGHLLPTLLREFKQRREELVGRVQPMIRKFYLARGWNWDEDSTPPPRLTVQGGIGNAGEDQRLLNEYGMDGTGWATPFLLVPEVTTVAPTTRKQLAAAGEQDLYLSRVSPLGIPFNNLRRSSSEQWTAARAATDRPGSPCPKGFLISNTEFTEEPICTASREYQALKIEEIRKSSLDPSIQEMQIARVTEKTCLCDHLGNSTLNKLEITRKKKAPESICPGPNLAWFDREYSLDELVDHIYGRRESLVPSDRPHMFAKEMQIYVNYLEDRVAEEGATEELQQFCHNLRQSIRLCCEIADSRPRPGENLGSIPVLAGELGPRLEAIESRLNC